MTAPSCAKPMPSNPTISPIAQKPAEFKIKALTASPATVLSGWPTTVTVDVTNIGEIEGNCALTLKVNNSDVETKEVTIPAGVTVTVNFTLLEDTGGTYNLSVGEASGILTVKEGILPVLHTGDQWVYRITLGGLTITRTETVTGDKIINNKDCYAVKVTYDPSNYKLNNGLENFILESTIGWEKETPDIIRWELNPGPTSANSSSVLLDWSYSVITGTPKWPLVVGDEWTEKLAGYLKIRSTLSYVNYERRYKVETMEMVTTDAGTFRCFKIVCHEVNIPTVGSTLNDIATETEATGWYSDKVKNMVKVEGSLFTLNGNSLFLGNEPAGGAELASYSVVR